MATSTAGESSAGRRRRRGTAGIGAATVATTGADAAGRPPFDVPGTTGWPAGQLGPLEVYAS